MATIYTIPLITQWRIAQSQCSKPKVSKKRTEFLEKQTIKVGFTIANHEMILFDRLTVYLIVY